MNLDSELTVRGLVLHTVDVPMNRPLKTGGGEVGSAAMVLIDLLTPGRSVIHHFCREEKVPSVYPGHYLH